MEQTRGCRELPASAELPSWGRQVFRVSRPPRWLQTQGVLCPAGTWSPKSIHHDSQSILSYGPSGTPAQPTSSFPGVSIRQMPPSCHAFGGAFSLPPEK